MGMSNDLYPVAALLFEDAHKLHLAAAATLRLESEQTSLGLSEAQTMQRKALLQLNFRMLVERRDKALDEFAVMWLRTRSIPIPKPEAPDA